MEKITNFLKENQLYILIGIILITLILFCIKFFRKKTSSAAANHFTPGFIILFVLFIFVVVIMAKLRLWLDVWLIVIIGVLLLLFFLKKIIAIPKIGTVSLASLPFRKWLKWVLWIGIPLFLFVYLFFYNPRSWKWPEQLKGSIGMLKATSINLNEVVTLKAGESRTLYPIDNTYLQTGSASGEFEVYNTDRVNGRYYKVKDGVMYNCNNQPFQKGTIIIIHAITDVVDLYCVSVPL